MIWSLKRGQGGASLTEFRMQAGRLLNFVHFHVLSSATSFGQLGEIVKGHLF